MIKLTPPQLSANSAALDLANSTDPDVDTWTIGTRYRPSHQSMPHTDSSMYRPVLSNLGSPPAERSVEASKKSLRHSSNVTFDDSTKFDETPTPPTLSRPGSLQTSYSTNDVPTLKNSLGFDNVITPPKPSAEQQFHNHNVNLGRIPANGINNRQSRELSNAVAAMSLKTDDKQSGSPMHSTLQASAAPFGPQVPATTDPNLVGVTSPIMSYNTPQQYSYNMQSYNVNQINTQASLNNSLQTYQNPTPSMYGPFSGYSQYVKSQESQGRRRGPYGGDETRYNNMPLESYRGNLYELCKDQHGCRYLQRKLEDSNPENIEVIFAETYPHIVELMTGEASKFFLLHRGN